MTMYPVTKKRKLLDPKNQESKYHQPKTAKNNSSHHKARAKTSDSNWLINLSDTDSESEDDLPCRKLDNSDLFTFGDFLQAFEKNRFSNVALTLRPVSDFANLRKIGEGVHGQVYKARDLESQAVVVLKKLTSYVKEKGFPVTSQREIIFLSSLNHENVIGLKSLAVDQSMNKVYIVMNHAVCDLSALMRNSEVPLTLGEVKHLVMQLLGGVAYLHHHSIMHRDLKPSNLMMMQDGTMKIGDFSLSRTSSISRRYTTEVVTLWYRAPELLLGEKNYSSKIDIWSVGCIFAEMVKGRPLFPGISETDQIRRIFRELGTPTVAIWPEVSTLPVMKTCAFEQGLQCSQLHAQFNKYLDSNGFELLNGLLKYDPSTRTAATSALSSQYFRDSPSAINIFKFRLGVSSKHPWILH